MKKNEFAKTDLYQLMKNNPTKTKEEVAKHFMELGYKSYSLSLDSSRKKKKPET
jgi:hypothetical protein